MKAIELMSPAMLERMRVSCRMAAACLVMVDQRIKPGISTEDINNWVHQFIVERNAYPAPLNYRGFPKSVCTSVNHVVCHGIPSAKQTLVDGDIVNVDVTTFFPKEPEQGFHGDTSVTFYVGKPSEEAKHVTEVARQCLELGIAEVRPGARIGDIGAAIQEYAEAQGCSVVRDYVGHGVGRKFHMEPQIPHYGTRGRGRRLKEGMVFTIEPMINLGGYRTELQADDWTVFTADRSLSAQFEHTLAVTAEGCEVLTRRGQALQHSERLPWVNPCPRSAPAAFSQA